MSVRGTENKFESKVIRTREVTRLDDVREYVGMVGMDYFQKQGNVEHALLSFWERGVRCG